MAGAPWATAVEAALAMTGAELGSCDSSDPSGRTAVMAAHQLACSSGGRGNGCCASWAILRALLDQVGGLRRVVAEVGLEQFVQQRVRVEAPLQERAPACKRTACSSLAWDVGRSFTIVQLPCQSAL